MEPLRSVTTFIEQGQFGWVQASGLREPPQDGRRISLTLKHHTSCVTFSLAEQASLAADDLILIRDRQCQHGARVANGTSTSSATC